MIEPNVPVSPPCVNEENIRSGKPVRSQSQWLSLAHVSNYLNSHEMTLVAASSIDSIVDSTYGWDYLFRTRYQVRRVLWVVVLRSYKSGSAEHSVSGYVKIGPGGTEYHFGLAGNWDYGEPYIMYILETRSQTDTAYTQGIFISKSSGDGDIWVDQIAAYQLRRYDLDPTAGSDEAAADVTSCKAGATIMDKSQYSVEGVVEGLKTAKENCRRASIFSWSAPWDTTGLLIGQGSSWNPLFYTNPEVLARHLVEGVTVTAISISVLGTKGTGYSATSTHQIRFVATSGDSATIFLGSSATWHSTSLLIKTEDLSNDKGRQSSTTERIAIAVYGNGETVATDGLFATRIYSICIGES